MPLLLVAEDKRQEMTFEFFSVLAEGGLEGDDITIDKSLSSIAQALESLPYKKFSLVDHREIGLPLLRRESLSLKSGEKIKVRPIGIDLDKFCFWLRWEDKNGSAILDSRMHILGGRSVVAGFDASLPDKVPDSALLLAFRVK
jgi:hypothetical protein